MSRQARNAEELSADIERFDLRTSWVEITRRPLKAGGYIDESRQHTQHPEAPNGARALELHIEEDWTVREVLLFRSSLRGGDFISPAGWKVGHSGIVLKTPVEDRELRQMWNRLVARAYLLMGAICGGGTVQGSSFRFGIADYDNLLDFSMDELSRLVPEDIAARLSRLENPEPPKRIDSEPLSHAGSTVYPMGNFPKTPDNAGRQFNIECGGDCITVIRGKGKRPQDRTQYRIPPSLREFVDALLTEYERSGSYIALPDGTPRKWQANCKPLLREIIQGEDNQKNGKTGRYRLWIE